MEMIVLLMNIWPIKQVNVGLIAPICITAKQVYGLTLDAADLKPSHTHNGRFYRIFKCSLVHRASNS